MSSIVVRISIVKVISGERPKKELMPLFYTDQDTTVSFNNYFPRVNLGDSVIIGSRENIWRHFGMCNGGIKYVFLPDGETLSEVFQLSFSLDGKKALLQRMDVNGENIGGG